jgi:DUF1680 family protein
VPLQQNVIPAKAVVRLRMICGIQEDAICYAVSAKGASPHRMRPSKSQFSKKESSQMLFSNHWLTVMLIITCLSSKAIALEANPMTLKPFEPSQIKILDEQLLASREANGRYLLELEPDRLLWAFRQNAGLPTPGEPYGGWEAPTCEVRGHFIGHYLSGCALMWAYTGDDRFRERGSLMVAEFTKCQEALNSGYLSAYPETFFDRLESLKDLPWAPYYTLHKIMAGLFDQYQYANNTQALEILKGMAGWLSKRIEKYSPEEVNHILAHTEEGGTCEALWNLYGVTRDPAHQALADKFEKRSFLDPLAQGEDNLTGRHGNTHIPLVVAAIRRYELTGEKHYLELAQFFWDRVVRARTYATGGTTNAEVWGEPYQLARTLSTNNHETCKTFNMLRLTRHLLCCTGEPLYSDYYECAFLNGILGTQEMTTGMLEYYVPQATGYQRVFGTPFDSFWCCYGTGIETWAKLGDSIYFHDGQGLYVNLFIASTVEWTEKGICVEQATRFPNEDKLRLTVHTSQPVKLPLYVRIPGWADQGVRIWVNGEALQAQTHPSSYFCLEREWKEGDQVELQLPMRLKTNPMPDDPNLVAYQYGPIVLAGVVDSETQALFSSNPNPVQSDAKARIGASYFVADTPRDTSWLQPVEGQDLTFKTVGQPVEITFKPFNQVIAERYGLYWWVFPQGSDRIKKIEEDNALFTFDTPEIIDAVIPGDEASEKEHNLQGEKTLAGVHLGKSWRHADEWWSWDLAVLPDIPIRLRCLYWGDDQGRIFDILVNQELLTTVKLEGQAGKRFIKVEYPIPVALTTNQQRITVTFRKQEVFAGGLFGCATLK